RTCGYGKWIRPGQSAVRRQAEIAVRVSISDDTPGLINIPTARPSGGINRHPRLVTPNGWPKPPPIGAAIGRAPEIALIGSVGLQTEIIKVAIGISGQHRVAAENVGFEHAPEFPVDTAIG